MKHGTFYGAFRKRCKCDPCRLFRNAYMRDYRKRLKERDEQIYSPGYAVSASAIPGDSPSDNGG